LSADQKRRRKAAAYGDERDRLRVGAVGKRGGRDRHRDEQRKRGLRAEERIEIQPRIKRQIEHRDAATREQQAVIPVARRDPHASPGHADAGDDAETDADRGRQPLVFERVAEEERDAEEEDDEPGVLEPAAADALLEVEVLSAYRRRSDGTWRSFRLTRPFGDAR